MLANGATLEVKTKADAGQFKKLQGLKELPEMGASPEKVENTTFEDKVKKYEQGIGDPGDMAYKFKYDNESAQSSYRILRAIEKSGEIVEFKETLKDKTTTTFKAQVAVKRGGGGVNGAIEFTATLSLQSDLDIVDPS